MAGAWIKRKKPVVQDAGTPAFALDARKKKTGSRARNRVVMAIACFVGIYGVIGGRLVYYGMQEDATGYNGPTGSTLAARPDILDRNGEVLATDIKTNSLFAEPRKIIDPDEAIELLSTVLPDLNFEQTYNRLKSGSGFAWLKRGLTPQQKSQIMALGIPGIGFRTEKARFYPGGPTASHILGLVNIDNQGIAGMEKYIDAQGLSDLRDVGLADSRSLEPVRLSIDLRVQHVVRDVVVQAMQKYSAIAAGAVVLNVNTGEVLAMASAPDFDPNNPVDVGDKDRLNRMSAGAYEMGSTIKSFTTAMALDSGKVNLQSTFDARRPITIGRQTIRDFHGKGRVLTLPEVFIYSSNIGSAREADVVGIEGHREFLHRLGLLDRMQTELPEVARPMEPKVWKKVHSITISFGHGMATTPLQTAVGAAALMNGGKLIPPTFLPRTPEQAAEVGKRVISEKTSEDMRYLYRLNAEPGSGGSGSRATVKGYRVGGKTGTAEKVVNGRYSKDVRFNAFVAAFPIDKPEYVVLTIVDEPKPESGKVGATAGFNAAPMVQEIIRRSASFLGVKPDFEEEQQSAPLMVNFNQ
ncbi:penicillin-binding protein 2 [Phyllobacterium sp. 21LDTY02-6]|uniref:peptidoglycan D,D-transpeptidase FtsI family protein n=1 Tax=unclassified Phyllobacterium TaxID=2638441 RepID=UPI00201FF1BF|nr:MULTISPECIES: penicillin-binding protein 2 [unclassified Phyllobacterium]MCO4315968.1 penicillin-binding protein 2 [Phyllobacterium sp. 21LDTY02-6]MCX8279608.1 penicillin-binding protein 2 [Phyllobacterium sp. 0TCS1.6C]MCX8292201.1 penicillin-binding protein 2 [Phyllobacterium sp. 0TCS1.6A]